MLPGLRQQKGGSPVSRLMISTMTLAREVKDKINKSVQYQFPPPLALLFHIPNTFEEGSGAGRSIERPTSHIAEFKED